MSCPGLCKGLDVDLHKTRLRPSWHLEETDSFLGQTEDIMLITVAEISTTSREPGGSKSNLKSGRTF